MVRDATSTRVASARDALREAEHRLGVRAATALTAGARGSAFPRSPDRPSPGPERATSHDPAVEPSPASEPAGASAAVADGLDDRLLPVDGSLAALFPAGGLQRGSVVSVRGSTGLLFVLIAAASRAGAWAAFVGCPEAGVLAAADAGVSLERLALVPRPGPDAPGAIAALIDGMDLVVIGPAATLLDGDRRRLVARARERGTVLVPSVAWSGAQVTLTVRSGSWSGAERGAGWLRRRTIVVERSGRAGARRPVRAEVELPLTRSLPPYLPDRAPASTAQEPVHIALPAVVSAPDAPVPDAPLRLVG